MTRLRPAPLGLKILALSLALAGRAHARAGGIAATSCAGCHNGGTVGSLALSAVPDTISPGELVQLTLTLTGPYVDGGAYVSTAGVGDLQTIADQGLREVSSGLVHERPKPASNGSVQFEFAWRAPEQPGAVRFAVYALGGNGNNLSSGDAETSKAFDFVYGCSGQTYYYDGDGDGVGRLDTPRLGCANAAPAMFVATSGDCDDYHAEVHPGAAEICNLVDDDCDGQIDEDVTAVELWPDADGDGYYDARTEKVGEPKMGCDGTKGWAARYGDCQPMNKAINPGAEEVCNNLDDNCDGDIDERVRPTCGEGWCRRVSPSCDVQLCRPGEPEAEKCNLLDDDCDGEIDEDANMCESGQICDAGKCVAAAGSSGGTESGGSPSVVTPPNDHAPAATHSSSCALGPLHNAGALVALAALAAALVRRRR